jgi:acetoin utilization deacetylase AcuC-like enzyme
MKEIPVFYSPVSYGHLPESEIFSGEKDPHAENQDRMIKIMNELASCGFADITVSKVGDTLIYVEQVHDKNYLDFLKNIHELATKDSEARGKTPYKNIIPSVHPYLDLDSSLKLTNLTALKGKYMFDSYTPIMENTYDVLLNSAAVAVASAKAIKSGERLVYGLTRPPGHHAEKAMAGGYCCINNVAVAAEYLKSNGAKKVAILDFDLHHGNGTQDIFYNRNDVLVVNIHGDPSLLFPYFTGNKHETGAGKGEGYNYNFPLPKGTGETAYGKTLNDALGFIKRFGPEYLLVSAGFDTYKDDPINGVIELDTPYFAEIGKQIAKLDLPTLTLQEGGYATEVLGKNVVSYLKGLTGNKI